jgi:hypothetical protein
MEVVGRIPNKDAAKITYPRHKRPEGLSSLIHRRQRQYGGSCRSEKDAALSCGDCGAMAGNVMQESAEVGHKPTRSAS